jgi:hypothetical protein
VNTHRYVTKIDQQQPGSPVVRSIYPFDEKEAAAIARVLTSGCKYTVSRDEDGRYVHTWARDDKDQPG